LRYVDEFREPAAARALAAQLACAVRPGRRYRFMEFCGGHTHALARHGVDALLPPAIEMVHGPGCPVCVLPIGRIDQALALARDQRAIVCTYGDTMRVPASGGLSLLQARAEGADVRVVYSPADALQVAREHPARQVVLFAIGFETTTPPTALALQVAARERLPNFSVLCCHVLTPPAIEHVLDDARTRGGPAQALDGLVGPGHVAVVTGAAPFVGIAAAHRVPVVIAGFEPLDLLQAVLRLVVQVNAGRAEAENAFPRAVTLLGNRHAQARVDAVLQPREAFEWRGLGTLRASALQPRAAFADFDAERRFGLPCRVVADHPQCRCASVLRGLERPTQCRLFGTACTPAHPLGACMVSSEGACAAHHGRVRWHDGAAAVSPKGAL
jgi:hydrogenase expression/formation protein HypD